MSGIAIAWLLIFLIVVGFAGTMLMRSLEGGMPLVERLYARSPSGRPSRR